MEVCEHCGQEIPGESLRCLYCGELIRRPAGFISRLTFGWRGRLGLLLALIVLLAFLIWIL